MNGTRANRRTSADTVRGFSVAGLLAVSAVAAAGDEVRFLRREDPVVVSGTPLAPLHGSLISGLRLFASRNGRAEPVPFQIDRRDRKGAYLFERIRERESLPWQTNPELARHTTLAAADELVFLARDTGPKLDPALLPSGPAVEIAARDPENGAVAYVYAAGPDNPAPAADRDYVRYDTARRIVESDDLAYGRCDPDHPAVFNYLSVGGSSNLLHRFRTTLRVTALFGQVGLDRDERDVETRLLAYSDGPVRVLLRQESRIAGVLWMQSEWVERVFVNYPTRIEVPTQIRVPFRPGLLISEARAEAVLELSPAAADARVRHPSLAGPLALGPSEPLTDVPIAPSQAQQCSIVGPFGGVVSVFREDPRFAGMGLTRRFVCRPGSSASDVRGSRDGSVLSSLEMHVGGIERIQRGTYRFRLVMSGRRNFRPGDEREFSQIDDAPLQIATRPVAPPPPLGTLPVAAGRR